PRVRWDWLIERKSKVVKQLTSGVKVLLSGRQVEIIRGVARLVSANRVVVAQPQGGNLELAADHVILATGATATMPPGFKLDGERIVTSQEALDLSTQPKRLAVR